jgi:hypothetical protein
MKLSYIIQAPWRKKQEHSQRSWCSDNALDAHSGGDQFEPR